MTRPTISSAVTGDHDRIPVDGCDRASLTLRQIGLIYKVNVTCANPPCGTLTIKGPLTARCEITPGSILHDLPLDLEFHSPVCI